MGNWKSLVEMEECLTLQELNALVEGSQKREKRHNEFMAAIQGIDITEDEQPEEGVKSFEEIKREAEAIRRGITIEEAARLEEKESFSEIGIDFA